MILLIDNYDSFTYNLVQRLGEIDPGVDLRVVRNDQITLDEIEAMRPTHLIISPGPVHAAGGGDLQRRRRAVRPHASRCSASAWATSASATPSAARIVRADRIMHGKTSLIHHDGQRRLSRPVEPVRGDPLS